MVIEQIVAAPGWFAVIETDGKIRHEPLAVWALLASESGAAKVIGMIAYYDEVCMVNRLNPGDKFLQYVTLDQMDDEDRKNLVLER